jgi:glucose-1-phosphate thymidylyltransferase
MRRADPEAELDVGQEAIAATGVKALIPIDRPFLDYVLSTLAEAGYRRICLVVGPEHDAVRRYFCEELACELLQIDFAVQREPLGTANALTAAEEWVGDEPFLMINSDNYYPVEALKALRDLTGPGVAVFGWESMIAQGNVPEERLLKFAVVESGPDGLLQRILEKPDPAVLADLQGPWGLGMNCWRFDARIFAACRAIEPSARGELELPDAVAQARSEGVPFQVLHIEAAVLDLSSRADVASVARLLAGREVRL